MGGVSCADVRETHSAVVLLMGERAYKVKKPVDLGFLDFTTLAARKRVCQREVELNRRLAPDVYLDVAEVRDSAGQPCDYLVVMRRMPDQCRLATLVAVHPDGGAGVSQALRRLARDVAAFHARAGTSREIAQAGSAHALEGRWRSNLDGLRDLSRRTGAPSTAVLDRVEHLALRYVRGRQPLLVARMNAGLVRDGHGDLLADDVFLLPDGPRALDCLEFDDRLRWMDVLDDVACLAMDLERLGAPQLAWTFLDDYQEFSGRPQPTSLRHHYIAYRAFMRAKVSAIRAASTTGAGRTSHTAETNALARLALEHLQAGRIRLVVVGGGPATGKTTLTGGLADRLGAVRLSSDRIRKEEFGLDPRHHVFVPFGHGIYSHDATRRTYTALAKRSRQLLRAGETVVVDASCSYPWQRDVLADAATEAAADLVQLRCVVPPSVARQRLERRTNSPDALSDAGVDVGTRLSAEADPWPQAIGIDTSGPTNEAVDAAMHAICSPDD